MTDIITVETSDHARLSLQLSYNWHFEVILSGPKQLSPNFHPSPHVGRWALFLAMQNFHPSPNVFHSPS